MGNVRRFSIIIVTIAIMTTILLVVLNLYTDDTDTILKILAALVSVCVLTVTYLNYEKTNFNNRFNQFLDQHNKSHSKLEEYIKNNSSNYDSIVNGVMCENSSHQLYKKSGYSPYLRLLYHILKFIDNDSIFFATTGDKKKYTSIVRSLITNDIMLIVAINSLNKDFYYYRALLDKFDFFEHLSMAELLYNNKYEKEYHIIFNQKLFEEVVINSIEDMIELSIKNKLNDLNIGIIQISSRWSFRFNIQENEIKKQSSKLICKKKLLNRRCKSYYHDFISDFELNFSRYINNLIDFKINETLNYKVDHSSKYIVFIYSSSDMKINDFTRHHSFLLFPKSRLIDIYNGLECKKIVPLYEKIEIEIKKYIGDKKYLNKIEIFDSIEETERFIIEKNPLNYYDKYSSNFNSLFIDLKKIAMVEYLKSNSSVDSINFLKDKLSKRISDTYLYLQEYEGRKFNMSE